MLRPPSLVAYVCRARNKPVTLLHLCTYTHTTLNTGLSSIVCIILSFACSWKRMVAEHTEVGMHYTCTVGIFAAISHSSLTFSACLRPRPPEMITRAFFRSTLSEVSTISATHLDKHEQQPIPLAEKLYHRLRRFGLMNSAHQSLRPQQPFQLWRYHQQQPFRRPWV